MECEFFAVANRNVIGVIWLSAFAIFFGAAVYGSDPEEMMGLRAMRVVAPNLNGTGIRIAQAETEVSTASPPPFEINPGAAGYASSGMTYFSGPPTSILPQSGAGYPNSLGSE